MPHTAARGGQRCQGELPIGRPALQAYFHQFELLNDRFLRAFPGERRTRHFLRLVEPLALTLSHAKGVPAPSVFDHFRQFYGIDGDSLHLAAPHDEL